MKLKILSGNIRGINSPEERCLLELHFRTWKADFLFLQQTKLQHFPQQFISHLGSGRIVAFAALETEGTRGGIVIIWDKEWLLVFYLGSNKQAK